MSATTRYALTGNGTAITTTPEERVTPYLHVAHHELLTRLTDAGLSPVFAGDTEIIPTDEWNLEGNLVSSSFFFRSSTPILSSGEVYEETWMEPNAMGFGLCEMRILAAEKAYLSITPFTGPSAKAVQR